MMETLIQDVPASHEQTPMWRSPLRWFRSQQLSRGYWTFFLAALFFDAGFSIYVFLFNLFLLDCGLNERAMGWIGGAMTFGSVVGTLPAGALARRTGLRPLLMMLFVLAPLLGVVRALWIWEPAQIVFAFLQGLVMSVWGVCFLPAIARLTSESNRTSGYSLIFSVSVASSIIGGIVCGYLRSWLANIGIAIAAVDAKRLILIVSCALVLVGLIPVMRLRLPGEHKDGNTGGEEGMLAAGMHSVRKYLAVFKPFLRRFLPCMALWCAVLAAFTPFANVYLERDLHISMERIGVVFSAVQVLQLIMGVIAPALYKRIGLIPGIVASQMATAAILAAMAVVRGGGISIVLYLVFSAAQWMSSPGLYNLLMNETPDEDRSEAAAMTLFCNALAGSAATALSGALFARFGYPPVLMGIAGFAVLIGLTFLLFIHSAHTAEAEKRTI